MIDRRTLLASAAALALTATPGLGQHQGVEVV